MGERQRRRKGKSKPVAKEERRWEESGRENRGREKIGREEAKLKGVCLLLSSRRKLNDSYVEELGIHYMSNWRDPWGDRTMTLGEVGCFLSHYTIWNRVRQEEEEEEEETAERSNE